MLKITEDILIDRVNFFETYKKGQQYFNDGRVREIRTNPTREYFIGSVYGSKTYKTTASFNTYGNISDTSCTCPAYSSFSGDCKHIVALLLSIKEYEKDGKIRHRQDEGDLNNIIHLYRNKQVEDLVPVNLEITYEISNGESSLSLRVGEDKLYVVKNLAKYLSNLIDEIDTEFGKNFTFSSSQHCFNKRDLEFIEFLKLLYENYEVNYSNYYNHRYNSTFSGKKLFLSPLTEEKFFEFMLERELNINIYNNQFKNVLVTDEKLEFKFKLEERENDLVLNMVDSAARVPITTSGRYFFYNEKIYRLSNQQANTILPIYNEMMSKEIQNIRIKDGLKESFVSEVLPSIKKHANLAIDKDVESSIYNPDLIATVYFDRIDEVIFGTVLFNYGDIEINPFSSDLPKKDQTKILLRDVENEAKILSLLELSDFKVETGRFFLEEEELIFDFINDIVPQLQKYCDIYYSDSFKNIGLIDSDKFSGNLGLNTGLDMLEFNFDIEGIDISELQDVFRALKEKKRYYKLRNGSFLSLQNEELNDMVEIFDYLDIGSKQLQDGKIQIPKYRTMYLDKLLKDKGIDYIKKNIDFKKLVRDINEPEDMEYEIPKDLNASLRDYQKFGFKWVKTLAHYGFGGILADEMGLGKTVQMLAFLLSEKKEGSGPSIAVVPTSLVYNWDEEVKKFAPSLKTLMVIGSKADRNMLIEDIKDYDLVITSYPLMRRDIDEYQAITFEHCILDEAQHIKNHGSLNAKSVKNIKAKKYFALTGTPMENSLSELWSIFDYLMPGYLLSNGKFSTKYEKPITKDQDNGKLKDLNRHIKPFILRRLKREVLKELPDKIEQKIVVDMTKEQKKLYLAYLQAIKGELSDEISTKGYNKSHIKILAGLTRLRQLCCHPGIFVEGYKGDSGKLDSLEEIVEEAINGKHRILIFSQFTTMLQKIRNVLEDKEIECLYLDGSTPMVDRGVLVKSFNSGVGDVFLISLKAGGTGLNLTAADMVIHYDPWWNPAVEDQATDRAHRIGQENKVQVIKLITKGTIEEKIFLLQEKKKEIIDKVITEGETLISKLSEEDLMSLFEE